MKSTSAERIEKRIKERAKERIRKYTKERAREGASTALTAILLTAAVLAASSFAAIRSLPAISAQQAQARGGVSPSLHAAVESVALSNPGTSLTVTVYCPGPMTGATVPYPPGTLLPDPAGIVERAENSSTGQICVSYRGVNEFSLPAGAGKVTIAKNLDGTITVRAVD